MKDFRIRLISGLLGLAFFLGCIFWNEYSFGFLFLLATVIGLWEFYTLLEKAGYRPMKYLSIAMGAIVFCSNFIFAQRLALEEPVPFILVMLIVPMAFLLFPYELFRREESPFTNISFSFSGIIYIALPFATLNYIVMYPSNGLDHYYHWDVLLSYFFILWANDMGAYFAGNLFGKHKLFERISPKKTWEGAIGGLALSLVLAAICAQFVTSISLFDWLVIATLIVFFGTLGDLVESFFKRGLGVKDTGNILPGHGGVMDRFDSLLLSVPFVFVYLRLFT